MVAMKKKKKGLAPLKVSLHGMNGRAQKMMARYLEINCNGIAHVVAANESDIEIIDTDLAESAFLLQERLSQRPPKPIIVFSLWKTSVENVIYVRKPVEIPAVVNALKLAQNILENRIDRIKHGDKKLLSSQTSEINKLQGFNNSVKNHSYYEKGQDSFLRKNIRKKTRYTFHSIPAQLSKSSFTGHSNLLTVQIENTSGVDALVALKEQLKLGEKVTLIVQSELVKKFVINAKVVRKEEKGVYALKFLTKHHKLIDSLFDSQQTEFLA